jgi:hypothetical protein
LYQPLKESSSTRLIIAMFIALTVLLSISIVTRNGIVTTFAKKSSGSGGDKPKSSTGSDSSDGNNNNQPSSDTTTPSSSSPSNPTTDTGQQQQQDQQLQSLTTQTPPPASSPSTPCPSHHHFDDSQQGCVADSSPAESVQKPGFDTSDVTGAQPNDKIDTSNPAAGCLIGQTYMHIEIGQHLKFGQCVSNTPDNGPRTLPYHNDTVRFASKCLVGQHVEYPPDGPRCVNDVPPIGGYAPGKIATPNPAAKCLVGEHLDEFGRCSTSAEADREPDSAMRVLVANSTSPESVQKPGFDINGLH